MLKNAKNAAKTRKTSAKQNSEFSAQSSTAKNRNQSVKIKGRLKNGHKGGGDFRQFISDSRDEQDHVSTPHGQRDSAYPLSDFASSYAGNDFLTSRFLSELPTSKLSWNLDSPVGKSPYENVQTPTDWEGTEAEVSGVLKISGYTCMVWLPFYKGGNFDRIEFAPPREEFLLQCMQSLTLLH